MSNLGGGSSKTNYNPKLLKMIKEAYDYFKQKYIKESNKLKKSKFDDVQESLESKKLDKDKIRISKNIGSVHIYSHLDTDGICAAAILAKAFIKEKIGFHITILKQLEEYYFNEITYYAKNLNHFIIFTDFGSGQLNIIEKYLKGIPYLILDHHEPLEEEFGNNINPKDRLKSSGFHANCFFAGVNGSKEISGAGMAYLFARQMDPKNIELSYLAIIGAIGDIQNSGEQQSFIGENLKILDDAIKSDLIVTENEPAISRSKPLAYALAYTLPFQVGNIKNDIKSAYKFLESININPKNDFGEERTLGDLSMPEKLKISDRLVRLAINNPNIDMQKLKELVAKTYLVQYFKDYPEIYDAKDSAKMINACGRLKKHSIALSALITNNSKYIEEAIKIMNNYTEILKQAINWLEENHKLKEIENMYIFYGEDVINENIVGIICSNLIYSSSLDSFKAVVGYADSDNDFYKISARCSSSLIKKGVNLSEAIRNVSTKLGLEAKGGGHAPASGALIPKNLMQSFIELLDKEIGNQKKLKK
ncbi:MAG: DHH family phosphoesterase [Promethearchaeota archaeon]